MSIQPNPGESARCGQPTTGDELQNLEQYRRAIESSGFLLEVRVANVLREHGYLMTPSSPIPHPDQSSELIEIDVEASHQNLVPGPNFSSTDTTLLIECKLNSQPIAFFSLPQEFPETNAYRVAYCADPVSAYDDLLELMEVEKWHHYARSATVASQLCSFTKNKEGRITTDPCSTYRESLNRLCLATAARALRLKGRSPEDHDPKFGFFIELIYPILVAAGPLLSVITEAEGLRLVKEDHIQLHRGARVGGTLHEYQIDVVTERALPTLLGTIQAEAEVLARWAESHRDALLPKAAKCPGLTKRNQGVAAPRSRPSANKANRNRR
jgi:hypothetical protein